MAKIEIYFFSGTGNSLYVARQLRDRLPGSELIPMVSLMSKEFIESKGEVVGFIFPIYMTAIPMPVKELIEKMELNCTRYIFAIATRIGTQHSAFIDVEKILKKKGKKLDAAYNLNMPSNDPKFKFKPLLSDEMAKLEAVAQEQLELIVKNILNEEKSRKKDVTYTSRIPFLRLLRLLVALTDNMQPKLYADKKCTGCGICARVCPSGKIIIKDGRPFWEKKIKCFKCNACLNFCPNQAVQIKGFTEGKDRYNHPYATVEDIAQQKKS